MKLTNSAMSTYGQIASGPASSDGTAGQASASQRTGAYAAAVQGTGGYGGGSMTPKHVAGIVIVAGLGLWGLRAAGFRFSFDAGFGK